MPEPLRLDVELGAKGVAAGIGEISKASDGLRVSSQKASFAVKAFANEIANAKDGSDVASAALGAFTRILGTSVAATVFAAGAKAIYDSFSEINNAVKTAEKSLADARETASKMGLAEGFAEGASQAKAFDDVADKIRKKIKDINDSPLQNLINAITLSTEKMAELATQAEQEAINRRLVGSTAELAYQKEIAGADAVTLARADINKELKSQLDGINVLKETETAANLTAIAELKIKRIEQKAADEERKAEQKNILAVAKESSQAELRAYDAEAKARADAQNILMNFEAAKAKAHQEELRRSAEKITAIKDEIKTLQERNDSIRGGMAISGGELAMMAARTGGSGRGPEQRKTSFEIGVEKAAERAEQEAQKQRQAKVEEIAKARLEERGMPSDKVAIQREIKSMAVEGVTAKTMAPVEEYNKLSKEIDENTEKIVENSKSLSESEKAQSELNKQANESAASFDEVNYSLSEMAAPVDLVSASLGNASSNAQDVSSSFGTLAGSSGDANIGIEGLGAAAESANSYLTDLASSASNLNTIFAKMDEMNIARITTDTIDTNSILLS